MSPAMKDGEKPHTHFVTKCHQLMCVFIFFEIGVPDVPRVGIGVGQGAIKASLIQNTILIDIHIMFTLLSQNFINFCAFLFFLKLGSQMSPGLGLGLVRGP